MAFPSTIDDIPQPTASGLYLNTTGYTHSLLHASAATSIWQIETKLGIDASLVTASIDYILKHTGGGHFHDGTGSRLLNFGTGNQQPASGSHTHAGGQTPASTVAAETAFGVATAAGTANEYARGDHTHGSPVIGTANAQAASGTHTHATGAQSPANAISALTAYGLASGSGTAATYARGDHSHGSVSLGTIDTQAASGTHTHTVASVKRQLVFTYPSALSAQLGAVRVYNEFGANFTITTAFVSVNSAPAGGTAWFDIRKNNTSIFAAASRPTVVTNVNTGISTTIATAAFNSGDYLQADVASAASAWDATIHIILG